MLKIIFIKISIKLTSNVCHTMTVKKKKNIKEKKDELSAMLEDILVEFGSHAFHWLVFYL